MGLGLAHTFVRPHGGTDEKRVGDVPDKRLVENWVVGRADEAGPHIQVGRADDLGVGDVDVSDHPDVPVADISRTAVGWLDVGHGVAVPDDIVLVGTQEDERAGDEPIALPDRHRGRGEGAPAVHAVDVDFDVGLGRGAPRKDGVDGLDPLAVLAPKGSDDRLTYELAAKDDPGTASGVRGSVPVLASGREVEGAEKGVKSSHAAHSKAKSPPISRWCEDAQPTETCTTSSTTRVRNVRNGPDHPSCDGRTH